MLERRCANRSAAIRTNLEVVQAITPFGKSQSLSKSWVGWPLGMTDWQIGGGNIHKKELKCETMIWSLSCIGDDYLWSILYRSQLLYYHAHGFGLLLIPRHILRVIQHGTPHVMVRLSA